MIFNFEEKVWFSCAFRGLDLYRKKLNKIYIVDIIISLGLMILSHTPSR